MNMGVSYVVELTAPTIELIKRLDRRGRSEKARSYDLSTEMIIHRLEEYQNKTAPVMELYKKQNKHAVVNAVGEHESIFALLADTVEAAMKKSR
jgi:adenylate kinase